jgi:tetratricopeptide (TPR) repeat protein
VVLQPALRNGWLADLSHGRAKARRLAMRAAELGREDAVALTTAGSSLAQVLQELDAGIALIDRARELNPNLATAWSSSAWARNYRGEAEVAIEHATRAHPLSPLDPLSHYMDAAIAFAHFLAAATTSGRLGGGRLAEARRISRGRTACLPPVTHWPAASTPPGPRWRGCARSIRQCASPTWQTLIPWRRPDDARRYAEGLRLAGLPD